MPNKIIFNPNTHCMTTSNDKSIHVWHPTTGDRLFSVTFDASEKLAAKSMQTQFTATTSSFSPSKAKKELTCREISCLCYSKKYHLYFCCMKNFTLIVFNEYLIKIVELPLKLRLVQECLFIDETQQLICAGLSGCFIVQLTISYGYDPKQAILLDPKGNSTKVQIVPLDHEFNED